MGRVDERLHLGRREERVVDPRVDRRGVVDVHHVGAFALDQVEVGVAVVVALGEMLRRLDDLERRHPQHEVVVQRLPRRHRARAAEGLDQVARAVARERDAALPGVVPRGRHHQRLLVVEVGVERAPVVLVAQVELQAGVDRADPCAVLVVLHVPLPREAGRGGGTGAAQAQFVLRHVVLQRDFQADVVELRRPRGGERDGVAQRAVHLQAGAHLALQRTGLPRHLPVHLAGAVGLHAGRSLRAQGMRAAGILHQQLHRRGQQCARGFRVARHALVEEAVDLRRQAAGRERHRAAEDAQLRAMRRHRGERLHQRVVLRQRGVQPTQAGEPEGIVVAVRHRRARVHRDRQRNLPRRRAVRADRQRAAVGAGLRVGGDVQPHPQRLHAALRHVEAVGERLAGVVGAAEVEAGEPGRRNRGAVRAAQGAEAHAHVPRRGARGPQAHLEAEVLAAQRVVGQAAAGATFGPAFGKLGEHADRVFARFREQQPRLAGIRGQHALQFLRRGGALHVGVGVEIVHRLVAEHARLRQLGHAARIAEAVLLHPRGIGGIRRCAVGHRGVVARTAGHVGLVVDRVGAGLLRLERQHALGLVDALAHHVAHRLPVRADDEGGHAFGMAVAAVPGNRRQHRRGGPVHGNGIAVVAVPVGVPAQLHAVLERLRLRHGGAGGGQRARQQAGGG